MINEIKLLNHIHQNADMAKDTMEHILEMSKSDSFANEVKSQMNSYEEAYATSEKMLRDRGAEGEDARPMSKFMADIGSKMQALQDPTDSHLADMVIQGSTMGITKLTKQINDYAGEDKEVLNFAKNQVKREQENIEKMKRFL